MSAKINLKKLQNLVFFSQASDIKNNYNQLSNLQISGKYGSIIG